LPSSVSGAGGQVAEAGMFQTRTNIPFTIHSCQVPSFCTPRFGRNAKRGNTFQRTPWTIPSPHSLPPVIVEKYWVAWHSGCIFPLLEYFADLLLMMPPTPETLNRFLARQPILTSKRKLFGYEILSRYGPENYCRPMAGEQFHVNGMDGLFLMGIQTMTEGLPAFLNCTREFLVKDYLTLMPRDLVVGEILETVAPDEEVLAACRRMKEQNYRFALDDYCDHPDTRPLLSIADFVKIDVLLTSFAEQKRVVDACHGRGIPVIAEKVETDQQFHRCLEI